MTQFRTTQLLTLLVGIALLAACAQDTPPPVPATPGAEAAPEAASEAPDLDSLLASADVKRGQTLFLQCRACHSLEAGEPHKVGPNLNGMFGRKAGLAPGFDYSPAVMESEIVWTPEALDAWLERPSDFLPGNRMVFIGVKKPEDRANLIAYLQQATASD
jgi:cytochrome c